MLSATDTSRLDVLKQYEIVSVDFIDFIKISVKSQFHCTQVSTTVLQDQDNPD